MRAILSRHEAVLAEVDIKPSEGLAISLARPCYTRERSTQQLSPATQVRTRARVDARKTG